MHHARGISLHRASSIPIQRASGIFILAGHALRGIAAAAAIVCAGNTAATEIAVSNPDVKMRLDATVRYTGGWRAEKPDSRLLANYIYDEGDAKFDRGDMVTNRLDLLTEFDV
ncbi:MAG TPA: DUF1302 family protein, partial [Pseudoduganella sp.]